MIPEEQQDNAALYVLDGLDTAESNAFEAAIKSNPELGALVRELREAAADMSLAAPARSAPDRLRANVMRVIALDGQGAATPRQAGSPGWIPWAIAAIALIFCGVLAFQLTQMKRELAELRSNDALLQSAMVALSPTGPGPAEAKAVVAWEGNNQSGVIRISNLPAQPGKDYQLWVIDADHADPISAGIIHVDANGRATMRFKPIIAANHVKAFAISLEREGGVTKPEGAILLAGSTS